MIAIWIRVTGILGHVGYDNYIYCHRAFEDSNRTPFYKNISTSNLFKSPIDSIIIPIAINLAISHKTLLVGVYDDDRV